MSYSFWPENTNTTMYIAMYGEVDFEEILDSAKDHFKNPQLTFDEITLSVDYIHTQCVGYDLYDPSDYTKFLVITLKDKND